MKVVFDKNKANNDNSHTIVKRRAPPSSRKTRACWRELTNKLSQFHKNVNDQARSKNVWILYFDSTHHLSFITPFIIVKVSDSTVQGQVGKKITRT